MPILTLFKTKPKKSHKAYLIAQIDAIMSKRVRERDGYKCRHCGPKYGLKWPVFHHHIFGKKAHPATRWEISNGISLCYHCHVSAHASPEDFRRWVISWLGEEKYEALYIKAQFRTSFKECDLEMLLKVMRMEKI